MNRILTFITFVLLFSTTNLVAQAKTEGVIQKSKEERFKRKSAEMIFPLIHGSYMTGVIPVPGATNKPKSSQVIKLVFDFTHGQNFENSNGSVNAGLEEVARSLNLHIAAGIKKENLEPIVVFHSSSILSILNDGYFQKTYGTNNPNSGLLKQLSDVGTELIVCGQRMALRDLPLSDLLKIIQPAVSAKTSLTKYQSMGYIMLPIADK
jgi:intracellular sulfur oxidation DsrE/DsrF family protein